MAGNSAQLVEISTRDAAHESAFGRLLKFWRTAYGLSQEDLSERIGVSARHISFLENGRNAPSRSLIELLGAKLDLRRRDTGNLLLAAGYLPRFESSDLESARNEGLRQELAAMLRHLDPFPAAVIDPCANVKMVNRAWVYTHKQAFGEAIVRPDINTIRLLVAKDGWRRYVPEWLEIACLYLVTLQQEAIMRGNAEAAALVREVVGYPEIPKDWVRRGARQTHNINSVRDATGAVRRYFNVHYTVGSTAYVAEPRLLIHTTYPEDGVPAMPLEKLAARTDLSHPLLAP